MGWGGVWWGGGSLNTLPASEPSLRQIPRLMDIYFSLTHVNARNDLWCRILLSRTSGNFNVCNIVRQRYLPGLLSLIATS